jgi:predicted amidophosphoribosyltransferase
MSTPASRLALTHGLEKPSGALTSVCFPAGCRLCAELLRDARRLPLCDNGLSSFPTIPPGSCDLCGQPGAFDPEFPKTLSICPVCQQRRLAFQLARSDERSAAVSAAFAIREGRRVDNLRILLLDDVMTTGATLDACSRALREAAAKSVLGLTIARAGRPLSSLAEHL